MKTDELDEKIIQLLKKDSRSGNVAISKELGLSEGAVRLRIKRLVDSGIIRSFTIEVGQGASNFAIIMVKAKGETKKMMAAVAGLAIHYDAYEVSGEYDGCIILEGPSVEEIDKKIDKIRALDEVADTKTYIAFRHW